MSKDYRFTVKRNPHSRSADCNWETKRVHIDYIETTLTFAGAGAAASASGLASSGIQKVRTEEPAAANMTLRGAHLRHTGTPMWLSKEATCAQINAICSDNSYFTATSSSEDSTTPWHHVWLWWLHIQQTYG